METFVQKEKNRGGGETKSFGPLFTVNRAQVVRKLTGTDERERRISFRTEIKSEREKNAKIADEVRVPHTRPRSVGGPYLVFRAHAADFNLTFDRRRFLRRGRTSAARTKAPARARRSFIFRRRDFYFTFFFSFALFFSLPFRPSSRHVHCASPSSLSSSK